MPRNNRQDENSKNPLEEAYKDVEQAILALPLEDDYQKRSVQFPAGVKLNDVLKRIQQMVGGDWEETEKRGGHYAVTMLKKKMGTHEAKISIRSELEANWKQDVYDSTTVTITKQKCRVQEMCARCGGSIVYQMVA